MIHDSKFGISYKRYPKEYRKLQSRHRRSTHPLTYIFSQAKYRAKQSGLKFNIKKEDLIIPKKCPILGLILSFNKGKRKDNSYSLDRVNTNKGYVKNNVRVISWRANRLKSNITAKIAQKLVAYINNEI